jgi:uncharacterized protein (TIGR02246 family)
MRHNRLTHILIFIATLSSFAQLKAQAQIGDPDEEKAVRAVLARFYEGWNTHDADKMVSVYAEDIDHINVFGEWQKGRATLRQELARLHAGPLRDSKKNYTIEKIRFLKPDVAIVQVSAQGTSGPNLGTYIMEKQKEGWVTVSFTNVAPHDPPWKK